MRRGITLTLLLIFLSSGVAALTINAPTDGRVYTEPRTPGPGESIYVKLSTSAPYNDRLSYRIPGAGTGETTRNTLIHKSVSVSEGTHTITATAVDTDGNTTQNLMKTATFTVDSLPPSISATTPHGTVTQARYPTISAYVTDTSAFKASLSLNGEQRATTRTNSLQYTPTNLSEGHHTVTVRAQDEHGHVQEKQWNFTLPVNPAITSVSPTGTVNGDVAVQVAAADPSGIRAEATALTVLKDGEAVRRIRWSQLRNGSERSGNHLRIMHTINLPDGQYTLNVSVTDNSTASHMAHRAWPVTVDTAAPRVSVESHATGDIITETVQAGADVVDALSDVASVRFTLGDAETVTATHLRQRYRGMLSLDDVTDGEHALTATGTDTAGNSGTGSVNVTVDTTPPAVSGVTVYPDTAASAVFVTGQARDTATRVDTISYRVDDTSISGTLPAADGAYDTSTEQGQGIVDVSQLEPGDYVLYLTGTDAAGHTSNGIGERFTVTNATPDIDMTVKDARVAAGGTVTLQGTMTNTGDVGERLTLQAESAFNTSPASSVKRVGPGEEKRFSLTATVPAGTDYGPTPVKVTGDGLATTVTDVASIIVVPPKEEREDIEQEYQQLKQSFNDLQADRSQKQVAGEQVTTAFSEANAALQNASRLMEEGRYDRAMAAIQQARQDVDTAENRFTGAVTRQHIRTAQDVIVKIVLGLLMLGAVYGGYRLIPPEGGYHYDRGYVHRPDGKHPLRVKAEHWLEQRRREREEREAELVDTEEADDEPQHPVDEWTGFME